MTVLTVFIYIVVFIFSAIIHEISHGYVAHLRGDDTAKLMGRITLNPLSHIDLFGSIILPAILLSLRSPILFGWAKPVPIDYRNFKNPKLDIPLVSLAGPSANLLLALVSGLGIRLIRIFPNFEAGFGAAIESFLYIMLIINVILTIINLIPIPPLDGSKVATFFMPRNIATKYMNINSFICLIVLLLLLSSGVAWSLLYPAISFFVTIFSGISY
ncbi:site-2 protease family protein [Candidatus Endomicrobiellum devescovinae]|jgi:Zn-dependent protease|uniref:site-2 protease family protein n=1 Tax=Candidatus Endomicrobiellum devescovinae TaxID=3242322 RepID=UPI0028208009|nr:site-2 protease family protein [Endomicrobium sp.]MDR1434085.1 site-2 protease family protein [Endomicrobium sp.]MDR2818057.1 site-2 protease family protein [Endomicrobium sp.]